LQNNTGGAERNLGVVLRSGLPVENGLNVLFLDGEVVAVADSALKKDADGVRQGGCTRNRVRARSKELLVNTS